MHRTLFFIYLLTNIVYTQTNQCSLLNNKLTKYGIHINIPEKNFIGVKLCQGLVTNYCCPQIYENQIQNATILELYYLFELYSIRLYEPLVRLTIELNDTIIKLIESSRNETHFILKHNSYRSSIDLFFNNLLSITYKNYQYIIKNNIEEFFRNILRISIELNNDQNKLLLPSYLLCSWRNHPFGNRPNIIANQLEINLGKLFHLNELLKLSVELVQFMSKSVTTDHHCIDSYMQLSYCNLCSGRKELPCLSNCENIIESCLVNISLIHDVWTNFIDSIENVSYFNGIEKILSSISISILDALMTFFSSDGIQSKHIINQCGYINIRKEVFDNDQKFHDKYRNSLSLLDKQLTSMRQSLQMYRSFWLMLPEQICKSDGLSISNEQKCWTGTFISQDRKQIIRLNYDKPLNLRLQWILKEIKERSNMILNIPQTSTNINILTSPDTMLINEIKLNATDDLDDYPNDDELHYSDYAYEDSIDGITSSSTTTTTLHPSNISAYDDISIDDINTVSYYDYGEQDAYHDDEIDETSTQPSSSSSTSSSSGTTTMTIRIPVYHQRPPIIWNMNIDTDDDFNHQYNSSTSFNYSFLLLLLILIVILT
ncbi:unnamed protein product [Adineta steineri]|uniref:Glypican-like protein n=1 Tax=Adineta steineri TaxID=433720 RepID=A0A815F710_9BILA|nr:unnamed protein product [Adineta steineri]CAF3724052.1 unnamed protein product [Adineta steineri]